MNKPVMTHEEFVSRATVHLDGLLDMKGKVLYSAARTLAPGEFYFLGLNPGGLPGWPEHKKLRERLENLTQRTEHEFVDGCWGTGKRKTGPGQRPLQKRGQHLFRKLGTRIEDVCTSNLIFTHSRNQNDLNFQYLVDKCRSVHECIIAIVQPRVIIVYGSLPYNYIRKKLGAVPKSVILSGHGNWECRAARTKKRCLIGLPHLSRYKIDNHPDVIKWIRDKIRQSPAK